MSLLYRAQAPAKILLFGEWAVLEGHSAVVTTVKKNLYCSATQREDKKIGFFAKHKQESQIVDRPHEAKDFFEWAGRCLEALERHGGPSFSGYDISWDSEWRVEEGMGSSSAVFLTLYLCTSAISKSPRLIGSRLFEESSKIFHEIQKGSGADLAAQCYGSTLVFKAGKLKPLDLEIPQNFRVIHTGMKWDSAKAIKEIVRPPLALKKISDSTQEFLETKDWNAAMDSHYEALLELKVIPENIQEFFIMGKKKNFLNAYKSSGAGGGDALLCLINPQEEKAFQEEIKRRGWWSPEYSFHAQGASFS